MFYLWLNFQVCILYREKVIVYAYTVLYSTNFGGFFTDNSINKIQTYLFDNIFVSLAIFPSIL
jgi:hypothetical protein